MSKFSRLHHILSSIGQGETPPGPDPHHDPYTVYIGTGSDQNTYLPTYSWYCYSLTNQIYKAGEINYAGTITSIGFFPYGSRTRMVDIYLKHVPSGASLSDGYNIPVTSDDLVFSGAVMFVENNWCEIFLDTPFEYNGSDDLLVVMDDNTGSYDSSISFGTFNDNVSISLYNYSDSTNYDPTVQQSCNSVGYRNRFMITFYGSGPTPPEVPTTNYFMFTNRGNDIDITIQSASPGNVFINDEYVGLTGKTYTIPAGAEIKVTGLRSFHDSSKPVLYSENTVDPNITIDRFDESITYYYDMYCMFAGSNCPIRRITSWEGAENYEYLYYTFYYCPITTIDTWDGLDNITTLEYVFSYSAISSLPASWYGLENLRSANGMFYGCQSLTTIPASWSGLEDVEDMSYMFAYCDHLTSIPTSWLGLHNVTNMGNTFSYCYALSSIPNSWYGLGTLRSMYYMFAYCTSLTTIPSSWANLSNVTDMSSAFYGSSITAIPDSWSGLSSVTTLASTFSETKITAIPRQWDVSPTLTRLYSTFSGCTSLTSMPDSWAGLEHITTIESIFRGCTSIVSGGDTDFGGLANITECSSAFNGCGQWAEDAYGLYYYLATKYLTIISHSSTFANCTSGTGYNDIPVAWGGPLVDYIELRATIINYDVSRFDGYTPATLPVSLKPHITFRSGKTSYYEGRGGTTFDPPTVIIDDEEVTGLTWEESSIYTSNGTKLWKLSDYLVLSKSCTIKLKGFHAVECAEDVIYSSVHKPYSGRPLFIPNEWVKLEVVRFDSGMTNVTGIMNFYDDTWERNKHWDYTEKKFITDRSFYSQISIESWYGFNGRYITSAFSGFNINARPNKGLFIQSDTGSDLNTSRVMKYCNYGGFCQDGVLENLEFLSNMSRMQCIQNSLGIITVNNFIGCEKFSNSMPLSCYYTYNDEEYYGLPAIKHILSWEGLDNLTTMTNSFRFSAVETIPPTFEHLEKITSLSDVFYKSNLKSITSWQGLKAVTSLSYAFYNNEALESIPTIFDNTFPKLTNADYAFAFCENLETPVYNFYSYLANKGVTGKEMFRHNLKMPDIDSIPFSWGGHNRGNFGTGEIQIGNLVWKATDMTYDEMYNINSESELYGFHSDLNRRVYYRQSGAMQALRANRAEMDAGWRIPTRADWTDLINTAGGLEALFSNNEWAFPGTNTTQMTLLPMANGSYGQANGYMGTTINNAPLLVNYMTSDVYDSSGYSYIYYMRMKDKNSASDTSVRYSVMSNIMNSSAQLMAVRLCRDINPTPKPSEVQIGTQIWSTKNLAVDDGGTGIWYDQYTHEYYYTRDAAIRIAANTPGWHLPTKEEFDTLFAYINGGTNPVYYMRNGVNWSGIAGIDQYGFDLRPAGLAHDGGGVTNDKATVTALWTYVTNMRRAYKFTGSSSVAAYTDYSVASGNAEYCLSVRLVKDSE